MARVCRTSVPGGEFVAGFPVKVDHPSGGYSYVPGIAPYSGGVRARPGHRIIHATFRRPPPWEEGLARIDELLAERSRPASALCSVELRCPEPHSFEGFIGFNDRYRQALAQRDLLLGGGADDGENPIARTNVAPVVGASVGSSETLMYAFGFTVDDDAAANSSEPSFVIAGAGDIRDQSELTPAAIIRAGDQWIEAGAERATVVLDEMEARMQSLGVGWAAANHVDVYAVEPIHHVLESVVLARMGPAADHGVHWHLAAPPIIGLTFEMDLRGGTEEIWL